MDWRSRHSAPPDHSPHPYPYPQPPGWFQPRIRPHCSIHPDPHLRHHPELRRSARRLFPKRQVIRPDQRQPIVDWKTGSGWNRGIHKADYSRNWPVPVEKDLLQRRQNHSSFVRCPTPRPEKTPLVLVHNSPPRKMVAPIERRSGRSLPGPRPHHQTHPHRCPSTKDRIRWWQLPYHRTNRPRRCRKSEDRFPGQTPAPRKARPHRHPKRNHPRSGRIRGYVPNNRANHPHQYPWTCANHPVR